MNIQYRGASDNTNNLRLAEIQYRPKEVNKVDTLLKILDIVGRTYYHEDEVITIEVDDKDDYEYVKRLYKNFTNFNYAQYVQYNKLNEAVSMWNSNQYTDYGLYESCNTDLDLYVILANEGYTQSTIYDIFLDVSGAADAYNNALDMFFDLLD